MLIDISYDKKVTAQIVKHVNNKIEILIEEIKVMTLTLASNIERDVFVMLFR